METEELTIDQEIEALMADDVVEDVVEEVPPEVVEVVPPPIIGETVQEPQISDEAYEAYVEAEAARIAAKKAAPAETAPTMPQVEFPEGMYDPDERIIYAATEIAKQMVQEAMAPVQQVMQNQAFMESLPTEAATIATQMGNDALAPQFEEAFKELGPGGVQAYKTDPTVKKFVDEAVQFRAQSQAPMKDDVPLPSAGAGVGGPGPRYSADERTEAEKFNASMKASGLDVTWEDAKR